MPIPEANFILFWGYKFTSPECDIKSRRFVALDVYATGK
jgi:hypothetical protein